MASQESQGQLIDIVYPATCTKSCECLHRAPGRFREKDFYSVPPGGSLNDDDQVPVPLIHKGLSCFSSHNSTLSGACHIVLSKSLDGCDLQATCAEEFRYKVGTEVAECVHFVVSPKKPTTFGELKYHWNYPQRPILELEGKKAYEHYSIKKKKKLQRKWEQARDALAAYDITPQGPGTADDQLQWTLCGVQAAADFVELQGRLFDDPSLQMVALALSVYVNTVADPNECPLSYLLYYGFEQNKSADYYSNPSVLSASSRSLIYCALANLQMDKDEFDRYQLDDLDEQRLLFLMEKFQPMKIHSFVAVGRQSSKGQDWIINADMCKKSERCIGDYISKLVGRSCDIEMIMCKPGYFLCSLAFPASREFCIRTPFTCDIDEEHKITIDHLRFPGFLLEEPSAQEMKNLQFVDSDIMPPQDLAAKQYPQITIDMAQPKEEEVLAEKMSGLQVSKRESEHALQPKEEVAKKMSRVLEGSVQCSAFAPSVDRQCLKHTLDPSGKCHIHRALDPSGKCDVHQTLETFHEYKFF